MGRAFAFASIAVLLAGCIPSVDFGATQYRCDQGPCPSGFVCASGRCLATAPMNATDASADANADAAISPTDAMGDGPGPEAPVVDAGLCKAIQLKDNFLDAPMSPIWTKEVVGNGSVALESGGLLILNPDDDELGGSIAAYQSSGSYDLTASEVSAMVPQVTANDGVAYTYLATAVDADNRVMLLQQSTNLIFRVEVAGGVQHSSNTAYNATNHLWWRLREASGTIYGEVSPNGTSWSQIGSSPSPAFLSAIKVRMAAGTLTVGSTPGQGRFDNINTTGSAGPSDCP